MIETVFSAIVGLIFVRGVWEWRLRRRRDLEQQLAYVKEFVTAAQDVYDDTKIPQDFKTLLRSITPRIDDEAIAKSVIDWLSNPARHSRKAVLAQPFTKMAQEQQELVRAALRCFFLALSYSNKKDGWRLRQAVTGKDARKAYSAEFAAASRIANRSDSHDDFHSAELIGVTG